jgi:hypothetical protein
MPHYIYVGNTATDVGCDADDILGNQRRCLPGIRASSSPLSAATPRRR